MHTAWMGQNILLLCYRYEEHCELMKFTWMYDAYDAWHSLDHNSDICLDICSKWSLVAYLRGIEFVSKAKGLIVNQIISS